MLSLVDLSEGGCQIILEKKVDPGKRVKLHMSFKKPDFKIDAEGEVRWCNRDTLSLAPKWPTGIEFKNLSHDDSAQLRLLLKNFQDSKE